MTSPTPDLEARLRRLAPATDGLDLGPRSAAIRSRGARRQTRRRAALAAAGVIPILVVVALVAGGLGDGPGNLEVASGPSASASPTIVPTPSSAAADPVFSTVEGLSLTATPVTDLSEGDQIEVRIDGLELLQSPWLVLCADDLTPDNAATRCDLRTLDRVGSDPASALEPEMTVTLRRTIILTGDSGDPGSSAPFGPYDCAVEGCVLAVGEQTIPVRGAAIRLEFVAEPATSTPEIDVEPSAGLQDRQPITVIGSGLRPRSTYEVRQCSVGSGACDDLAWPRAQTDAEGRFETEVPALTALYGWTGVVDCTQTPCEIVVSESGAEANRGVPISFAEGVVAPTPTLAIDPAGPYVDDQEVTVTGTGFPPGFDIGGAIGQCPDGLDTAVEERCGYSVIGPTIVAADGTFEMVVRVQETLATSGSCTDETGCHLGWVLNHGPTIAKLPLDFVD